MAGIVTDESIHDPSRGFVGDELETLALGVPFMAAFLVRSLGPLIHRRDGYV